VVENIYFHIGFPKTATTFLQKSIYPLLENVHYVPILTQQRYENEILKILFEELSEYEAQTIRKLLLRDTSNKDVLFSQEEFSAGSISTRFLGIQAKRNVLKNIKKIFSQQQLKMIVGIREQTDIIRSFYLQHLHQGGTKNLKDFLDHFGFSDSSSQPRAFFDSFNYCRYLDEVIEVVGEGNYYVYIYENLRAEPMSFVEELLGFFGEYNRPKFKIDKRNKGYGELAVFLARILNRLFKTDQHSNGLLPIISVPKIGELSPRRFLQSKYFRFVSNKEYRIPEDISAQIRKIYLVNNMELRDKYGLVLPKEYFAGNLY
jgi:hypothetical protein